MTHHDDEVHHCDLACGRPAPHTWICWDCHAQLVTQIDAFSPDDLAHLQQIARREATPATRPTAHTTHQHGPSGMTISFADLDAAVAHATGLPGGRVAAAGLFHRAAHGGGE